MNRSAHRPDIRVSQDTGQVSKLGTRKSTTAPLPPSFRSQTWTTNRTVTSFSPNATTNNLNATNHTLGETNGSTRGVRPTSAGAGESAGPSRKTTEKEYVHNLQQQIQILELQSKYLRDRDANGQANDEDLDEADLASIGRHMAILRKKCISLENNTKQRVNELEAEKEESNKKLSYTEHLLEAANEEKESIKRDMERLQFEHQGDRDKLFDDVLAAQKISEKHSRTIAGLEKTRERLNVDKEKLRSQLATNESERGKLTALLEAAHQTEKTAQKRDETLMTQISGLQHQLEEYGDIKQKIALIEQSNKTTAKQLADEKWATELKLRQTESSLDQALQAKLKLEADCKSFVEETTKLRSTIDELQREIATEKQKLQVKNKELVTKAESEGQASQKSNQFFQKWKESSEKQIAQQQKMDELQQELSKVKQEVELLKEDKEQLHGEADQQTINYIQIEEENVKIRKENLVLHDTIERLKKELGHNTERVSVLSEENTSLQAHYDILRTRMEMMKEIDKSLNQDELEQMKNTNLQVADTVSKLAQKLSSLSGERDDAEKRRERKENR